MEAGELKRSCPQLNRQKMPIEKRNLAQEEKQQWQDSLLQPRRNFSYVEAFLILTSLVTYLVDTLTDILVGVQYIQDGEKYWGGLTFAFVIGPAIVVQLFSFRWYAADGKMQSWRGCLVHVFLLQPLERYCFALVAGMDARHSKKPEAIDTYFHQQNDVCMLRLFEAFLESAPQLTLQLYIMMYTDSANWLTGTAAAISLLALGLAVAAYSHALRQAHRDNYQICWPGLALQTLWHISMTASRVLAIVAFTSLFKAWVFLFLAVHWVFMTSWVIAQNTDFCQSQWEEVFFDCVVGVIYCYSFFNLKEGRSRWRMLAYYTLILLENSGLLGAWYYFRDRDNPYNNIILGAVIVGFVLGLCCLLLYYRYCHPSGPIFCCHQQPEVDISVMDQKSSSLPVLYYGRLTAINNCSTPHLSHRISAGSNFATQVSLPSKQPSSLTLSRRSLLKSHVHLNQAKVNQVQYKEVATPSNLSPIKCSDQSFDTVLVKSPIYADTTDIHLDDMSAFQHYSVDATACLVNSRCNTLNFTGVDLSRAGYLDDDSREATKRSRYQSLPVDDIRELSDSEDCCDSPQGTESTACASSPEEPSTPPRPRRGSVHCMSCGYAPCTLDFYPKCCQSPAYKQGLRGVTRPILQLHQSPGACDCDTADTVSLSSRSSGDGQEDFESDFQELAQVLDPQTGAMITVGKAFI